MHQISTYNLFIIINSKIETRDYNSFIYFNILIVKKITYKESILILPNFTENIMIIKINIRCIKNRASQLQ